MNNGEQKLWDTKGSTLKGLRLKRPCECGCDFRDGVKGVGYLIGGDGNGEGVTIWIETEEAYQRLETAMGFGLVAEEAQV